MVPSHDPIKAPADLVKTPMDELKTAHALNEAHHARCTDYVEPSGLRPGLLLRESIEWPEIQRLGNTV